MATLKDLAIHRDLLASSTLNFTKMMFKYQNDSNYIVGRHHLKICEALDEVIRGDVRKLIINIAPRYGKCIAPNTRVYTTRGLIDASDVVEGDMLYSYDNGKLVIQRCQGKEYAHKESVRITMRSGRIIECSADHPMLTTFGYKQASLISQGERIVALRSIVEGNHEIPDEELDFITMMIFDGCCCSMEFSKGDDYVLDIMRIACSKLGFELRKRKHRNCDYGIYSNRSNGSRKLLEKYNIYKKKSYDKRLPQNWFTLSKRQRLRFIDLMFATDGYVQSNGSGVTLANRGLIEDIQYILSSLGIISSICYKKNDKAGAWVLSISRAETIRLLDMITFMQKRKKAEKLKDKKPVFITDSFPYEIIRKEKMTYLTNKPPYRCVSSKEITREKFIRLSETFPQLKKYILNDFYYDRVEKLENIGTIDLIHIGVDKTHNFIANGLVSHNTLLVSRNFIANGLALNPCSNFLLLSYSETLTQENSMAVKDILETDYYKALFKARVRQGQNTKTKWKTIQGGGVYATSTLGQITGFGAGVTDAQREEQIIDEFTAKYNPDRFAGAIVIDDPIKPEDALSDNARELVNRRFETTIRNRVNSRKTPIVIIMQRLHEHDLCGYLQEVEPGEWKVLSLPCIYEEEETGEERALWDFKHTLEELRKLRDINPFVFETQYMQNPKPLEGLLYNNLRTYDVLPIGKYTKKNYTDTADTGSDFLCSICYNEYKFGMYITDIVYTKKPMEYTEVEVPRMLNSNGTEYAIIESNNGGRAFARNVEKNVRELGNKRMEFKTFTQSLNKQSRIYSHSAEVQNLIFFPSDWEKRWPEFARDVKGYRKEGSNANDDAPDVLTGMTEYFGEGMNTMSSEEILSMLH